MAYVATTVSTTDDLQQILQLQKENLSINIDEQERKEQGFVTLHHTVEILQQMHDLAPSIIVKDGDRIAGYALVMPRACRELIPDLEPMFALFDTLSWNNKPLNDYRFYVMGQICIAKEYRGKGLIELLYHTHRDIYQSSYDFMITEVALRNQRSMRAHERVGFKTIHTHRDELDEWAVIVWDWK
jgi:ribosomal protein S18 acetylase RimI-like enzyme